MNSKEITREIINEENVTYKVLADKAGYKSISGLSSRLYNKTDMHVGVFAKILDALDCDLVVRSRKKGHKEWVISPDGSGEDE